MQKLKLQNLTTHLTSLAIKPIMILSLFHLSQIFIQKLKHFIFGYSPKQCQVTYYLLALLLANASNPSSSVYKIHGLWPDQCNECLSCGYPTFCKPVEFNISNIESLLPEINEYWFLDHTGDYELLKHEYKKHGSCTNMTEFEYFNTVLNIYTSLKNDQNMLDGCRQLPDPGQCCFTVNNKFEINSTAIHC